MKKTFCIRLATTALLFGSLTSLPAGSAAAEGEARLNLKPGSWELTSDADTGTAGKRAKFNRTVCLEDGDPVPELVKDPCKSEERALKDGLLTWKIACTQKKGSSTKLSGHGELRGEDEAFSGRLVLVIDIDGKLTEMKSDWQGKRVGDCKKP